MNRDLGFKSLLAGCTAFAMLAGCGGAGVAPVANSAGATGVPSAHSWIEPGAARGALLYATGYFNCGYNIPYTCVYSYPSGRLVGSLAVGDTSICSDRKGNVFFPDQYNSSVLEYAHGAATPFALLNDPGYRPVGCSVDPQTGNLAVINGCAFASSTKYCVGPGSIAIYRRATGNPTFYQDEAIDGYNYGGYDASGNLFVDGVGAPPSEPFAFAELPRDGTSFTNLTLDKTLNGPAQVQWDGSAMTIEDEYPPAVYRLKISGSTASVSGMTHFRGKDIEIGPTWIHGGTIVVPYGARGKLQKFLGFWQYPAGGKAAKRIVSGFVSKFRSFDGVTISVAR
jgi:hypothetical protein